MYRQLKTLVQEVLHLDTFCTFCVKKQNLDRKLYRLY